MRMSEDARNVSLREPMLQDPSGFEDRQLKDSLEKIQKEVRPLFHREI